MLLSIAAVAQDRAAAALDSLPSVKKIDQVAISPDGAEVAYIVEGQLSVATVADGTSHRIAADQKLAARDVAWSADSRHITWLSDLAEDAPASQLWTALADGSELGEARRLEGLCPDAALFARRNQGRRPVYRGYAAHSRSPATDDATGRGGGREDIRATDCGGRSKDDEVHAGHAAGCLRLRIRLGPGFQGLGGDCGHGSGDNNWWIARLYTINEDNGQLREIYKPKWQIAEPRVSPDGKYVAFIEGLMSDEGLTGGDIHIVPVTGGVARNLTPGIKASPSSIAWTAPDRMGVVANVDGNSGYCRVVTGNWLSGGVELGGLDRGRDDRHQHGGMGAYGFVLAGWIGECGGVPVGEHGARSMGGANGPWKQITHLNKDARANWGESRNVHWSSPGKTGRDTRVQGWLMLPKDYDPAKKYPLIVNVHGGPSWACTSHWQKAAWVT